MVVEFSLQRWIYRLTSSKNGWRLKLKKLWRHNMQHYLNYVDGQWRDASRQLEVINPATDKAFATVA
ncbi:aldehyde dehydrogenase, partial [Acinetobacter baumannii]